MKKSLRSERIFIEFVFICCFVLLTRVFDQEPKYLTSSDKLTFNNIGEMRMSGRYTMLNTIIFFTVTYAASLAYFSYLEIYLSI